jgi:hypothetical protein
MVLNKSSRSLVQRHNYVMFKHFLSYMNMGDRLKRSTIPAYTNVLQLIENNISRRIVKVSNNLMPYAF